MPSGNYKHEPRSKEVKLKISLKLKGIKKSKATRDKMSLARKGKPFSGIPFDRSGIKHSSETKSKMSYDRTGEKNSAWKGGAVKYRALHMWVVKRLGKAKCCEICKLDKIPEGKKRYFQWANISKIYKRDLLDWKQLCIPCHKKYDSTNQR